MTTKTTKKQRKDQIMQAAITCFADKGYHETSMDDIVREAGLSKGALYWYFDSKRALFQSLVELWLIEFSQAMAATLEEARTANEKLAAVVNALKQSAAAQPELARAQLEFYAMAMRDEEFRAWLSENYATDIGFLEAILMEGIETEEFRAVPVQSVARMIMAYLDGALLHREIHGPELNTTTTLDEVLETLTALLKA